jgi:hypothetical protein
MSGAGNEYHVTPARLGNQIARAIHVRPSGRAATD